jgi:REP element-mobilizing transposase RayT
MRYDPKKHQRRSIRLHDYDYAQVGAYFVTICAEDHSCLFGDVIDDEMRLNDAGRMVQVAWSELPDHYPGVETDAFVIMSNHVHAIIVLAAAVGAGPRACPLNDTGQPRGVAPTNDTGQPRGVAPTTDRVAAPMGDGRTLSLPDVVQRFKTWTTKRYTDGVKQQGWPAFPRRLWQRNYYEHIIRNAESLNRIRQYIANNPASWALDKENPQRKSTA